MEELLLVGRVIMLGLIISGIGAFIQIRGNRAQDKADEAKYGYKKKKPKPMTPP